MKILLPVILTFGFGAIVTIQADSMVRIKCDDQDIGTKIYFNNKYVGECPADIPTAAGKTSIRAQKIVNKDYEQLFNQEIYMTDGGIKKIDLVLSPPQLTANAKHRQIVEQANQYLKAAEAGDFKAMYQISDYYNQGYGVEKDQKKAQAWLKKAKNTEIVQKEKAEQDLIQDTLNKAQSGNIEAMEEIAQRAKTGRGMNKDEALSQVWTDKANKAKAVLAEEKHQADIQAKIAQVNYYEYLQKFAKASSSPGGGLDLSGFTTWTILSPIGTMMDITAAPFKMKQVKDIREQAVFRPANWGKADSMIAKANALGPIAPMEVAIR